MEAAEAKAANFKIKKKPGAAQQYLPGKKNSIEQFFFYQFAIML